MTKYYAGIEGGATHSTGILLNENGETVTILPEQPSTNHWNLGMSECCNQIIGIIEKMLQNARLPPDQPLSGLGLCLSGCEERKSNDELKSMIQTKLVGNVQVEVESDCLGPLYAASSSGGIVIIAGTGSNILLTNPDKTEAKCGGLSYLLGDHGSAWWIAHKAVRTCVLHRENYKKSHLPIDYAWKSVQEHFGVKDNRELLKHCYQCFDKAFYAQLTMKLAQGAEEGDPLCKEIFRKAGEALAKHILAIHSKILPELFKGPLGLPIVCIGSVWKSWNHLKGGFTSTLGLTEGGKPKISKFSLMQLTVPSALGAALMAAPNIPRNYSQNSTVLYSYGV